MELIFKLIQLMAECVNQNVIEQAMIERGAGWVKEFEREQPAWAYFIKSALSGPPESVLSSMILLAPDAAPLAQLPLAREFVARLQQQLKG